MNLYTAWPRLSGANKTPPFAASGHTLRVSFLLLLALLFFAPSAFAALRVGEAHSVSIETPPAYETARVKGKAVSSWSRVLTHPGATYMAVHFARFDLAPGEILFVSDDKTGQGYMLSGRGKMNAGKFWSQHVKGDTIRMELVNSGGARGAGLEIDQYAAGYARLSAMQPEATCGANDLLNATCFKIDQPVVYDHSRPVARLLIDGAWYCTGWLASPDNVLITNEHCIQTADQALNTDFEFMSEAPNCGDLNSQGEYPGVIISGARLLRTSPGLDYAAVKIESANPAASYGFLQIDNRAAVVGEEIYIPQHPGGRAKEIALFSTYPADTGGVAHIFNINATPLRRRRRI